MIPPRKPFEGYKWRWATLTPTEGLNEPPVYLGVLRVLKDNEGSYPSSPSVAQGLALVQREVEGRISTHVRLDRIGDRNLLRNSGQYWKALGLLRETRGIRLTPFGDAVASGDITRDQFAATVVTNLTLPNRSIQSALDVAEWDRHALSVRPLHLILHILRTLQLKHVESAFLTAEELIRVTIPLAGANATVASHCDALLANRLGSLDLAAWPDCAPGANDRRMATEFLLFLTNYNLCVRTSSASNLRHKYALAPTLFEEIGTLLEARPPTSQDPITVVEEIRRKNIAVFAERVRVLRPVLARPEQGRFRKSVLFAYSHSCLLTGEKIPEVLEAAHIIPVENRGSDTEANGICLRSDLHSLFDCGHLRIAPGGSVVCSEVVRQSSSYRSLPTEVSLPHFLSAESVAWRWRYL